LRRSDKPVIVTLEAFSGKAIALLLKRFRQRVVPFVGKSGPLADVHSLTAVTKRHKIAEKKALIQSFIVSF